jgi:hypothetical protein
MEKAMVQTITRLNEPARQITSSLLLEILEGEITEETRTAITNMGDLEDVPEPFNHLVGYVQGASMDSVELATRLLEELRFICVELQEEKE